MLIAIIVIAVVLLLMVAGMYNRIIQLNNLSKESWADIDVVLKRRHDLIPNLVETAKGYANFEQATLTKLIEARNQAIQPGLPVGGMVSAENGIKSALAGFFGHAEAYPDLKASANFLSLQTELAETEDRIAAARRFYNSNVRDYNTAITTFPIALIASMRGDKPKEPFMIDDPSERNPISVKM